MIHNDMHCTCTVLKHVLGLSWAGRVGRWCWVIFSAEASYLVGQRPIVLPEGLDGGYSDIFSRLSFSLLGEDTG